MDLSLSSKLVIDSCRSVWCCGGYESFESLCVGSSLKPVLLERTVSTMTEALTCSGACAVLALEQAAGRGRRGRVWLSPRGGIWLTVRARCGWWSPLGLPVFVGAVVAELLGRLTGVEVLVKWPNDLVTGGGFKVGGVLVEEADGWLLVGVGVDYLNEPPVEGSTSLSRLTTLLPDLYVAAGLLASAVARAVRGPRPRGMLLPRRLDYLAGRRVVVETEEGVVAGRAAGVDADGRLIILLDNGLLRRLECCSVTWAEGLRYKAQ